MRVTGSRVGQAAAGAQVVGEKARTEPPAAAKAQVGGVTLSPAARLIGTAQGAYRASIAERLAWVRELQSQVASGQYRVDKGQLCDALLQTPGTEGGQ